MNLFFLNEIIGYLALFFVVVGFTSKKRVDILTYQNVGFLLFSIHFYFLKGYSGAIMSIVVIARNIIFNYKNKFVRANMNAWLFLFLFIICIMSIVFWQGPITLLPTFGLLVGTYGVWQIKESQMRFFLLVTTIFWIFYTIQIRSYPGLINQIVLLLSLMYSIYKFDIKVRLQS